MKEATPAWASPPSPFAGSDWFDPLEEAVRGQVRAFIEQLLEEELEAALGRGALRARRDLERPPPRAPAAPAGHHLRPAEPVGTAGSLCTTRPASRSGRAHFCRLTSGSAAAPRR